MSVEDFWKRTLDLIKEKHISRKEFSSQCGFGERRIESLVNGNRYPDLEEVYAISKNLNVSIEFLCTGEEPEYVILSNEQKRVLSLYDKLQLQSKFNILDTMEQLSRLPPMLVIPGITPMTEEEYKKDKEEMREAWAKADKYYQEHGYPDD